MSSADPAWLCIALVCLFGALAFLRVRFPMASKRAETAVLATATVLFFFACNLFLPLH